jgi:hypothetical protein
MALQLFKIQSVEISSPTSSVTFSSIPQGYTDLKLVGSVRSAVTNPYDFIYFYMNGASGVNYPGRYVRGDGSSVSTGTYSTSYFPIQFINGNGATANTFGSFEMYIPNYTSANYKSFSIDTLEETNSSGAFMDIVSGNWTQTTAISSLLLASGSGLFTANSTFTLYGVL